jgi:kanamycin kinase
VSVRKPLAGPAETDVDLPPSVRDLIGGRPYEVVWVNQVGGLTVAVGWPVTTYVKWAPRDSPVDLGDEVARLAWASAYSPVPEVITTGADGDGAWMITRALAGDNAVSARWKAEPARAARALGEGLRTLHESLPVASCPYDWRAATRLALAVARDHAGTLDWSDFARDFPGVAPATALGALSRVPTEDLVVCHGDACAPNTLLDGDGRWVAHVDVGRLGVGDRWADLAVAAWSTEWNYGPGFAATVYDAYGVAPDLDKITYYRMLWEVG